MKFRSLKRVMAVVLTALLAVTAMPSGLTGLLSVKAAEPEITKTTTTYDFTKSGKWSNVATVGAVLPDNYGIILGKASGSGVSNDGTLRFRNGNVLYFPIKDDTTKATVTMTCNGDKPDRLVIFGDNTKDTTYNVAMSSKGKTVTVDDIDDYIRTVEGKKYLALVSNGDIKAKTITIDEYNPINSVTVSGTVEDAAQRGVKSIKFKNLDNDNAAVVIADIDASGKYTAVLKRIAGNTNYIAVVTKAGSKVDDTNDANKFTLTGNSATAEVNFKAVEAPVATVAGTFTGVPDAALKGDIAVELVPDDTSLDTVTLSLTKTADGNYTYAQEYIVPDKDYAVVIKNADDYEVIEKINKAEGKYSDVAINASKKPVVDVKGSFVTSDKKNANVTKITFKNMDTPDYTYTFDVSGKSYSVKLRAGEYETSVECEGYTAYDHVSVGNTAVSNDVYLNAPEDTSAVAYEAEVKVGAGQKFEKIADAVKYIARMERSEDERVTVVLTDDLYREQVIVDTPNITIKSVKESGSTITWYYGVGFSYYSAKKTTDGKNGSYYDEAWAVDKYYKTAVEQNPGHWGSTVNLFANAKGFKAENITFENSLNRYLTQEELADGADKNVTPACTARTTENIDVRSKAAKERAAVIYIQADDTEYKDCKFLSSQDTVYTGDAQEVSYFKNCVIEGTTDYICGDGNPVFDECTLSMYSYSDMEAVASYIVASKAKGKHGYIFNNCKIVTTSSTGLKATSKNILARAWGAGTVTWLNTEVESANMIDPVAYKDMNAKVKDAHYYEYNTHTPDGTAVDTSARAEGVTILTAEDAAKIDIKALHTAGEWIVDKEATAEEAGSKHKECTVCGHVMEEAVIDKLTPPTPDPEPTPDKPEADVEVKGDAPTIKNDADTVKEIESSVKLTDEEKEAVKAGADIKFKIVVKDEVKAGDKELIDTKISSLVNNGVVGKVFDITIEKQVGNNAAVKAEFNSEITLKVQVPEELINKDDSKTRTYKVIRVHDGEVTVIDKENCVFDEETGLITFKTDKFSTYAIVYEDAAKTVVTPGNTDNNQPAAPEAEKPAAEGSSPNTGDMGMMAVVMMMSLMAAAMLGAAYVLFAQARSRKRS